MHHGDCLKVLKRLPDNSVDSIVQDPPYGISFMSKDWDTFKSRDHFINWMEERQVEHLRVLKPGGFQAAFAGTRTYHWMAYAIESAGFDINDQIDWMFSSGFPKGLNVGKAIQKKQGVKPVGKRKASLGFAKNPQWNKLENQLIMPEPEGDAAEWDDWNTCLRPMHEGIVLAQKPKSEKTIAENVLRWGVGGINIRDCRFGRARTHLTANLLKYKMRVEAGLTSTNMFVSSIGRPPEVRRTTGRWPGNLIIDEGAAGLLDRKGIDRFYFCPKPSREEKEAGCETLPRRSGAEVTGRKEGSKGLANGRAGTTAARRRNHHPTCKPIALMRYLVRLLTPIGGTVLDAFAGSGSTGCACMYEGLSFVGITDELEHVRIAEARLVHHLRAASRASKGFFR
jgi:site-specific DNA-methyltransferase (adenine-specific)